MKRPLSTILEAMLEAGCTAEQIVAVVRAHDEASAETLAKKREQNRIRQQKHRARNAASRVTVRDNALRALPPETKVSPTPLSKTQPPYPPSSPKGDLSPRQELAIVLDEKRTEAVIDHRQRIRKPLTAHAAKLLAGKFAKCANPNDAADAMIANGWQGFEPEWLDNRRLAPRQGAPPPGNPYARKLRKMMEARNGQGPEQDDAPTLDLEAERDEGGFGDDLGRLGQQGHRRGD